MANSDLEDLGEAIKGIIQSAIDSQDFQKLNQTVNSTMKNAARTMEKSINSANTKINEYNDRINNSFLFTKTSKHKVIAWLLMIFGYFNAVSLIIAVLFTWLGAFLVGEIIPGIIITMVFMIFIAIFGLIGYKGTSMLNMTKRFHAYIRGLGGKTYINIEQLTYEVRKPYSFVRDDLIKMIHKGWFLQGHLDREEKTLIVSNDTYNEYLRTVQQEVPKEKKAQQENNSNLSKDVQEVLDLGNTYIEKIHQCNDNIPGVEISLKIEKMENIIRKIFKRVEQHPENIPELRKFMKYYLPTTIKLLEAYEEMDQQEIQGENIEKSKKEIENTLDTLNLAFGKLLDNMFRNTAWDVSSDASVLESLLAQDGLTDSGLK